MQKLYKKSITKNSYVIVEDDIFTPINIEIKNMNNSCDYIDEFWYQYYKNGYPTGRVLVSDIRDYFTNFCLEFGIPYLEIHRKFWSCLRFTKEKKFYQKTGTAKWVIDLPEKI